MAKKGLLMGVAVAAVAAGFGGAALWPNNDAAAEGVQITMYKSPTCGCCTAWEDHMREAGFEVESVLRDNLAPVKQRKGVTRELASCHTAVVDGYVVEGHVPADDVIRMLDERPDVAGLAVPGMPMGSPGMEGSYKDPYDVIAFDKDGRGYVYESHNQ